MFKIYQKLFTIIIATLKRKNKNFIIIKETLSSGRTQNRI